MNRYLECSMVSLH